MDFKKIVIKKNNFLFEFIRLDSSFKQKIVELQKVVVNKIENKEIFHPDTEEEIEYFLNKHIVLGCFNDCNLIAYLIILKPGLSSKNIGLYLNINENICKLNYQLETAVVSPDWRGFGFQRKLIQYFYKHIEKDCPITSLCSPENISSLKTLLNSGLDIFDLKEIYKGKKRFLMYGFPSNNKNNSLLVSEKIKNYDKLLLLFKKGYFAFKLIDSDRLAFSK